MYAENAGQVEEFIAILKRRKWQILLPAVFILALSIVLALIIPGKYVIEAKFELRNNRVEKDRDFKDASTTSTAREVSNAADHLRSFERVRSVIQKLGWNEYANLKDLTLRKEYISSQVMALDVDTATLARQSQSSFVSVTYKHVDGLKGVQFLRELVGTWAKDLSDRDEQLLLAEKNGLQNDVDKARRFYLDAQGKLSNIEKQMNIIAWNTTGAQASAIAPDPYSVALGESMKELDKQKSALAEKSGRLESIMEQLPQMEDDVSLDTSERMGNRDAVITALEAEIVKLRAGQVGLTSRHSQHRRLQREIERIEEKLLLASSSSDTPLKRLERRPNLQKQAMETERDRLQIERAGLNSSIVSIELRVAELREVLENRQRLHGEHEKVSNELGVTRLIYNAATVDLSDKEMTLNALTRLNKSPFIWTKQPFAPADPSEPNPLLIIALGLVGGLAIGLGSSVLVEFSKNCYRNVGDVTAVMTLPVLGVVNEIITSQQRHETRVRGGIMVGSSIVMLTVIGWFTWAYTRKPELLPTAFLIQVEEFRSQFE
ncbi:MAG: succinoglycan biosynthesis transport protein ExoP [Planctomycetota bacterium]|jgi:succinoglycan biosynthesis transport protein ExoP